MSTRTHYVYRLLDAAGELLYVGITTNPAARRRNHSFSKDWWPEVTDWRLSGPYSEGDAREVERVAIRTERPRHNKQHLRPMVEAPPAPVVILTTAQAARELRVSVATVNRWADASELPTFAKAPGLRGARFFDARVVEALRGSRDLRAATEAVA